MIKNLPFIVVFSRAKIVGICLHALMQRVFKRARFKMVHDYAQARSRSVVELAEV